MDHIMSLSCIWVLNVRHISNNMFCHTLPVTALNDLTFDLPKPIHRRHIHRCYFITWPVRRSIHLLWLKLIDPCFMFQYKACSKKRLNICYKDFILQYFKHCPLQSSPLYWRYTVPNVSSIVETLPGTHFLWRRSVLLSHFPESPRVQKKTELFK
jgi:hypothetical protein